MTQLHALPVVDPCWNRIGVRGDRSCPELRSAIHCHNCRVFAGAAQALLDRPVDAAYLAELTSFVAEPAATRKLADQSAVLFRIGAEAFAIETAAVSAVADAKPPRRVPHRQSELFSGLINIDGRLELSISLRGVLGLPAGPERTGGEARQASVRVLVALVAGQRWVLPVDVVVGVARFHPSNLVAVPATARRRANGHVTALLPSGDEHFGLLDLARICEQVQERLR